MQDPTPTTFSAANLDIDKPCTVLTSTDAADISGLPYYRTIAANLIDGERTRCAQGVGAFGLHGVVEVDMVRPLGEITARDLFDRECRGRPSAEPAGPASPPAVQFEREADEAHIDPAALTEPPPAPLPVVHGPNCLLANGAHALLLGDRVAYMRVRQSAGETDPAATRRLASLVSFRLSSN
ncbi:MAG: hypothetical protein NW206_20330 [Hyphomonadaceae bacterium]|nr:hypothetical protein [Hyphomonadaceae bacterium]